MPDPLRPVFRGGPIELERMGSADPPLAVHCLYADRHRQLRCDDAGTAPGLAALLAAVAARLSSVHGSVPFRAAVCHQVAQQVLRRIEMTPKAKGASSAKPASRLIERRIRELGDWRGETLARMRELILQADPKMTEE